MYSTKPSQNIIHAEDLASSLSVRRNFDSENWQRSFDEWPRLNELLWFIQAMSMRPGGLNKFVQEFIDNFADRIGNAEMNKISVKNGRYSPQECLAVYRGIPRDEQSQVQGSHTWLRGLKYDDEGESLGYEKEDESVVLPAVEKLNYSYFLSFHRKLAEADLPNRLASWCNQEYVYFLSPWFFPTLIESLIESMDQHSKEVEKQIATTEVTLKVFDAMDYAWSEHALVRIEGDSRFGKTESVKTWCEMNCGKARLVSTPCSNSDADLYKEVATALGIQFSYTTPSGKIKEKVEFVIRHSGLMFVFDEAHFLLPTRFTANTPPMRLNWIRTQIVDKKCATVLVSTPQDYKHCVDKFVRATGHNIQQFLGRTMLNTILPNELEMDDLLAVAQIHFPELKADYLQLIASKAMQSESYLFAVETIAKRARYISRRDGHANMTLEDLKQAISEIMPCVVEPSRQTSASNPASKSGNKQRTINNRLIVPSEAINSSTNRISSPMETPICQDRSITPEASLSAA